MVRRFRVFFALGCAGLSLIVGAPVLAGTAHYNLRDSDWTTANGRDTLPPTWTTGTGAVSYGGKLDVHWLGRLASNNESVILSGADAKTKGAPSDFVLYASPVNCWGMTMHYGLVSLAQAANLAVTVAADGSSIQPAFALYKGWDTSTASSRHAEIFFGSDNPLGTAGLVYQGDIMGSTPGGAVTKNFNNLAAGNYEVFVTVGTNNSASGAYKVTLTTTPATATPNYSLTVTKSGTGTVSSLPAGISCGSGCSASYASGTSVTLTAAAGTGYEFTGWGGACSGTAATCTVSMTAAKSVTAAFSPSGNVSGLLSAVLPSARSVTVGKAATAFGTIINTTGVDVTGCYVALPASPSIPASFNFQATNASNQLVGTLNTPVTIPAGKVQSFVFGITPSAAFNATDIPIVFDCANTQPAPSQVGLNTFLLSASTTPVPDMVAIGATPSGDGVLRIPGSNGVHAFGTAAVNIGGAGEVTATVDTGGMPLPLTLTLCQTNPGTGECLSPPASSTTSALANNASATYAVFAKASGVIPFDPTGKRIFLRLSSGGVVRGATSVAVTTQ